MIKNNSSPPRWPLQLLNFFLKEDYLEEIEGDMEERFQDNLKEYNPKKARRLYFWDSIKLLRPSLMKDWGGQHTLNHYGMFKHQFKLVWRQTINQKLFSSIKIGGFAVGIAACILISLYVVHQVSYDQNYKHKDQVYRLVNSWNNEGEVDYWSNVHGPLKELLEDNIPDMEKVARVVLWSWGDAGQNYVRKAESSVNNYEEGFFYADPELLEILEVEMVYGSRKEALLAPNRIVISRKKADLYFKDQNPVGQTLILNDDPEKTFTIGGVMENFPATSHLQGDFILTLYERKHGPGTSGWCCTNYNLYTKLNPMADKTLVEEKVIALRDTHIIDKLREQGETGLDEMLKFQGYYLQPVSNIYLNPEKVNDNLAHGSIELVWIFGCITFTILVLASINFVNLSIAKSLQKAKEVGLKKTLGSYRSSLIYQYLVESCLYTLFAVLLGSLLAGLAIAPFNEIAGTSIQMPWITWWFIPLLFALSILIGIFSGLYPALYLSKFQPIEALRNLQKGTSRLSMARNMLIVFQFSATIILIIAAFVTREQFQFLMNKSLGYDKEQVINIPGLETMDNEQKLAFKNELLNISAVKSATIGDYLPVEGGKIQNRNYWVAKRRDIDQGFEAARWVVDEDYIKTMGMEIILGRDFNLNATDDQSVVINERMAKELAIENPLGTEIVDMFDERYTIIGVVKDFHFESLFGNIRPLAMVRGQGRSTLLAKLNGADVSSAIFLMDKLWNRFKPGQSFRYSFIDQKFEMMYAQLNQVKTVFIIFSVLSIVIACSGLFALSLFLIGQRSKEVCIRKILGASLSKIFWLLSFDFIKLVLISVAIAIPLGWYFMDYMLSEMANRIELSWYIFFVASAFALVVTLGTISFEAIKAVLINPADQLRSE